MSQDTHLAYTYIYIDPSWEPSSGRGGPPGERAGEPAVADRPQTNPGQGIRTWGSRGCGRPFYSEWDTPGQSRMRPRQARVKDPEPPRRNDMGPDPRQRGAQVRRGRLPPLDPPESLGPAPPLPWWVSGSPTPSLGSPRRGPWGSVPCLARGTLRPGNLSLTNLLPVASLYGVAGGMAN